MTGLELVYIVTVIFIGTFAINLAIALVRNKLSNKQRAVQDADWELKIDAEEAEDAAQQSIKVRCSKSLSTASSNRGFLHNLPARTSFVDGKLSESDMISAVECMMREVRVKFDEVAYLGKHTSRGRENDACLYARYRLNGLTKCIGEVSSLRQSRHGIHVMVSLTGTDAALVQEKCWGVPSSKSSFNQLAGLFSAKETSEIVMPLPRNIEELRTVTQPVVEAAICSVGGVEPCA